MLITIRIPSVGKSGDVSVAESRSHKLRPTTDRQHGYLTVISIDYAWLGIRLNFADPLSDINSTDCFQAKFIPTAIQNSVLPSCNLINLF